MLHSCMTASQSSCSISTVKLVLNQLLLSGVIKSAKNQGASTEVNGMRTHPGKLLYARKGTVPMQHAPGCPPAPCSTLFLRTHLSMLHLL